MRAAGFGVTLLLLNMHPDRFFDYLDGKLSETEKTAFEQAVEADPHLRREMAIAREMYARNHRSREVMGTGDELEDLGAPPSKLGRRLITAFAALVLVNVLVGIEFIIGKHRPRADDLRGETALRAQVDASLDQAAQRVLPVPTLGLDDIKLFATTDEREAMAVRVITIAANCGGSAARALSDASSLTVLADIPANREVDFRRGLAPLGDVPVPTPEPGQAKAGARAYLQVRILDPSLRPPG